jgi:hypothetical protein
MSSSSLLRKSHIADWISLGQNKTGFRFKHIWSDGRALVDSICKDDITFIACCSS